MVVPEVAGWEPVPAQALMGVREAQAAEVTVVAAQGGGSTGWDSGGSSSDPCSGTVQRAALRVIDGCDPEWVPYNDFPSNFNISLIYNGVGGKPKHEYLDADKCIGLQAMWNNYPNNEVLGYLSQDGKLIVTDVLPLDGGAARGL